MLRSYLSQVLEAVLVRELPSQVSTSFDVNHKLIGVNFRAVNRTHGDQRGNGDK